MGFRGVLVAAGDFRQIGPVVRDANSIQQIQASPRLSQAWPYFKQLRLDAAQRTRDDPDYDAHVTALGDGASTVVGFTPGDKRPVVDVSFIPNRFDRTCRQGALNFTFNSSSDPSKCAVLAPTNVLVDAWNDAVQVCICSTGRFGMSDLRDRAVLPLPPLGHEPCPGAHVRRRIRN